MSECSREVEHAKELQAVADRSLRNEGRIKRLEEEQEVLHELATSVAVMAEQLKTINANVVTLTGKVNVLEAIPGKRWNSAVEKVISLIVASVVGFILAKIGF